jgi:hypothetical protein
VSYIRCHIIVALALWWIVAITHPLRMTSHNVMRGESNPPYSRKRSSTVSSTSMFKNVPHQPLQIGDTITLSIWVLDTPAVPVVLNHDYWPGVAEGDMVQVTTQAQGECPGFLFIVPNDAGMAKQTQQQVCLRCASLLLSSLLL